MQVYLSNVSPSTFMQFDTVETKCMYEVCWYTWSQRLNFFSSTVCCDAQNSEMVQLYKNSEI